MSYVKRMVKLYEQGKVDDTTMDAVSDYFLSRRAKSSLDEETEKVFEELYSSPEVSKYPKNIAQQYFQTLKHFSPHIATDPLSAKTYLLQMLDWEDAQTSTPISTVQVRDLAEIEAKSMDALAKRPASKFEISRFTDPLAGAVTEKPENLYTDYILAPKKPENQ
jgi:hypothetical protein